MKTEKPAIRVHHIFSIILVLIEFYSVFCVPPSNRSTRVDFKFNVDYFSTILEFAEKINKYV